MPKDDLVERRQKYIDRQIALDKGAVNVEFAGRKGGYGNAVILRHQTRYTTLYGHLSGFGRGIRAGSRVEQGTVIGYVGSTGLATGPR